MHKVGSDYRVYLIIGLVIVFIAALFCGIWMGQVGLTVSTVLTSLFVLAISMLLVPLVSFVLNNFVGKIADEIQSTVKEITDISKELVENGNSLSEGTSAQASSIQETAS